MLTKLILIGASRGIGRRFVELHAGIAEKVLAIGSSDQTQDIKSIAKNIDVLQLDISNSYQFDIAMNLWLNSNFNKSPDRIGIVCFASKLGEAGGLFDTDPKSYLDLFECNLISHLTAIKAVVSKIRSGDSLRIVMFGGGGAAYGYPEFFGYSLSKVATIRSVENISIEFLNRNLDARIIALAPGAVDTDMLRQVVSVGGKIKTRTDISEPVNFVYNFLLDRINTSSLNGRFLHVRDEIPINISCNHFMLRRFQ
jgi:NAD(P)-dependent dehydrogenase (short-subunit alcohol dehydrogenase family)